MIYAMHKHYMIYAMQQHYMIYAIWQQYMNYTKEQFLQVLFHSQKCCILEVY